MADTNKLDDGDQALTLITEPVFEQTKGEAGRQPGDNVRPGRCSGLGVTYRADVTYRAHLYEHSGAPLKSEMGLVTVAKMEGATDGEGKPAKGIDVASDRSSKPEQQIIVAVSSKSE
ncbi:hypothetical protein ACLOJK_023444 [Asimina triloba]